MQIKGMGHTWVTKDAQTIDRVRTGGLSKIQGLLKTILQFSRTETLRKILIYTLKLYF